MTSPPEPAAVCGICSRTVVGEDGSGASSPPAICDTCSKAVVDEEDYNESSQVVCGVCSKDIIDGDDDALLCEGQCASWLHRSCAGITLHCYDELAKSPFPFVCYGCSLLSHRSEISHLQSEIDKLSSVVASLRSSKSESSDSSNSMKDAASVKKKSRPQSQKVHSHSRPLHSRPLTLAVDNSRSPIPVDNARKIWGTMKAASSKTV